jgi:biopolymer transport protein TolR
MAVGLSSSSAYEDEAAPMSAINVTPLVDVTLVLLIVFMITVPAIVGTAPIEVELPETANVPAEVDPSPIVFTLKHGAAGHGAAGKVELYLNEERVDEAGVRKYFQDLGPRAEEQEVSLSAEKGIVVDHVYALYDLLLAEGVKKLRLNTRHVEVR